MHYLILTNLFLIFLKKRSTDFDTKLNVKEVDDFALKNDNPLKINPIFNNNDLIEYNKTPSSVNRAKQPSMGVHAYSLKIKRNRLASEETCDERVVQRRYLL